MYNSILFELIPSKLLDYARQDIGREFMNPSDKVY